MTHIRTSFVAVVAALVLSLGLTASIASSEATPLITNTLPLQR